MSPVPHLKTSLACTLIFSLFMTGLLTLTTGQSRASNNSLPRSLTSTVSESAEKTVPRTQTVDEATRSRLSEAYGKLSIRFEANQGQFDRQVQFLARSGDYSLFLTSSEVVMVLTKPPANKDRVPIARSPFALQQAKNIRGERENRDAKATGRAKGIKVAVPQSAVLRMKLEGANPEAQAEGLDELPGKTNYFIGNDPHKWHTDIPSYARVMYRDVYPGVDLLYYGREQQLEYDFVVAPGVDPANIKLNFEGAQSIDIDAQGDLVLHTEVGDVHQHKPAVYQEVDGAKREIPSRYEMKDSRSVGFHVDAYDTGKPLVIDPILLYSTFLGNSSITEGAGIAVDAAGNAYVVGHVYEFDFPVGDQTQAVGEIGSFVAKLNRDGSALIYSTFIGGTGWPSGIAVDMQGSAYITGYNYDVPDFPVVNAVQATSGGRFDAFVTKLSPQGSALVYSTYLGGSSYDTGESIAVDAAGNAYVTGATASQDFPVVNAFQSKKAGHQAFKSTNSGGSWRASDSGLNATTMNDLIIDPAHPSTLYSATDQGVFKSQNGGNTWHSSNRGIDSNLFGDPLRLAIDPAHTSTVFVVADYSIFKSTNGGSTWATSLYANYVQAIAIDPVNTSTIYASAFSEVTGKYGSVFKSTDGGGSWKARAISGRFRNGAPVISLAVDPKNNSIVYAGTDNDGVYKSTDGGGHWISVTRDPLIYAEDLAIDPLNSSIVYASTYDGIYKSTDSGSHWQAINNGLPAGMPYLEVPALSIDPLHSSVVYAVTAENGLYKTTDGGANWSAANTGLTNRGVRRVAINPTDTSKVYVATNSMDDAFVAKLNPSGSSLAYSTYLGGNEEDYGYGIALDSDGHAFLTGATTSSNFPVENPLQASLGGSYDAFVTKMDASGSSLAYSTYLGGNDFDVGYGITVDASGNAYVTGGTLSADFPLTPGAFQTSLKGWSDAFVTKINAAGSNLAYSTYLGGNGVEWGRAIALNSSGQAFIIGQTSSVDFPLMNATQSSFHYLNDIFVTRLNAAGSSLIFSTYIWGSIDYFQEGRGIVVDPANNIYVTGTTNALNFPVTPNAFKRHIKYAGAFVTKIGNPPASIRISGRVLLNNDGLGGVTVTLKDRAGSVLQTTMTQSDGSYSFTAPGGGDYTVTPSQPGQTFNPPSLSYTKVGTDLPMQNFKASTIIIRVQVLDIYGNGLQNVRIGLSGSRSTTCTTNVNGFCGFRGLSRVGRYTVTSSTGDTTFSPSSRTIINPSEDQTVAFKAAFSISGRVTGFNGIGIGGVTLALSGDRRTFTTTDNDGNYKFTNLPGGGSYTVTPSKGGMMLNPTFARFDYLNAPGVSDFEALVSITGKVRRQGTTSGISGVTVKLTGSRSATTTTGSDGIYTFSNLPAGGNYTMRPVIIGYTFSPSFRTFTDLRVSQGFRTSYFDGTP